MIIFFNDFMCWIADISLRFLLPKSVNSLKFCRFSSGDKLKINKQEINVSFSSSIKCSIPFKS